MFRLAISSLVALVLVGVSGCGGEPGLVSAKGRVTYNGKPVPSGTVYFTPTEDGKRAAHGTIDANGYFVLGTFAPGDGAYVGKHKVSVDARGPDKPIPPKMKGKMMPEDMQGTGDPLVPKKYLTVSTSDLTLEVKGSGNNFEIDLKD